MFIRAFIRNNGYFKITLKREIHYNYTCKALFDNQMRIGYNDNQRSIEFFCLLNVENYFGHSGDLQSYSFKSS